MADQPPENDQEGSRLRKQNDELRAELHQLKQERAIERSKLDLTERQVRVISRELEADKKDFTAENIVEIAKDLGFGEPKTETTSTAPTTTDPDTPLTDLIDPVTGELKPGLSPDQYRRIQMQAAFAAAGGMKTHDPEGNEMTWERFEGLLRETHRNPDQKTGQDEAMKLIQTYGAQFGMMDSQLVD